VADRSNFQAAIKSAARNWSKVVLERAKKNAPRHIAPHIYTRVSQASPEKVTITLGVHMVDSFSGSNDNVGQRLGAVRSGGSMDAAALEFGSEPHIIKPRKRTFSSGKPPKKYGKDTKTWLGVGMATQRSWLVIPNMGYLPSGAGKGYKPNLTGDGNFIFVHEVDHPGSSPYKGRGYLRISIRQTKAEVLAKEKPSIAKALGMDIKDKFRKSAKVMFIK